MIQIEGISKVRHKQNNILYIGNEGYIIGKEEGHMVNLDGSPVQVKSLNFTMQGRTKQFSDTRGIGMQPRGFALGG